jgi:hypothetical protein
MKPDAYKLLMQCIETGIELGWRRAHKHNDTPDEDAHRKCNIRIDFDHEGKIYKVEWQND